MKVNGRATRTIWLNADGWGVDVIDQRWLPHAFRVETLRDVGEAATAIRDMWVRGAPLIGVTAAYGVALAMREDPSDANLDAAWERLHATRPTAINLRWALDAVRARLRPIEPAGRAAAAYAQAAEIADEDVAINRAIGRNGLAIIRRIAATKKPGEPVNILTHCNAGWLATVDYGTATAPIYLAMEEGIPVHVYVDETRPRNQGASLTAWEFVNHGTPHTLIVDNAGGHLMQHGLIDMVVVGTDRTTARRRRLQQDRHLPQGAGGEGQRRAVLRRAAVADHRLDGRRRREGDPDRGALRRRGGLRPGPRRGRQGRAGAGLAGGQSCGEPRLRRDAGAARHRPHHRARRRGGVPRGAEGAVSGTRLAGRTTIVLD